jgi:peroxiredoxin
MPVFELPDPDGNPVRSEGLRGTVVVLRFWATW